MTDIVAAPTFVRPSGPRGPMGVAGPMPAAPGGMSIYHQDWFLDAATDRRWAEARVLDGDTVVGRMRYALDRRAGFAVSHMPSLVRTLGPEIYGLSGKPATVQRRRNEIVNTLIDQLPGLADFSQVFDPRITDAFAFIHRGFGVHVAFAFWHEAGLTEDDLLARMLAEPRRHLRKAADHYAIEPLNDVDAFCRFHDANLRGDRNFHGTERMRHLLQAVVDRKAGMLLAARTPRDELVGTLAILWDDHAVRNYIGARRPDASEASTLLLWEAMRLACGKGLAFDFDGVISPRMFEFLSGLGGTLVTRLRVRRSTLRFRAVRACASLAGMTGYIDGYARAGARRR